MAKFGGGKIGKRANAMAVHTSGSLHKRKKTEEPTTGNRWATESNGVWKTESGDNWNLENQS